MKKDAYMGSTSEIIVLCPKIFKLAYTSILKFHKHIEVQIILNEGLNFRPFCETVNFSWYSKTYCYNISKKQTTSSICYQNIHYSLCNLIASFKVININPSWPSLQLTAR